MIGRGWAVGLAALASLVGSASAFAQPQADVSLILLTLDTTRADSLRCYGAPRASTANLDALAARGTRYARALTPSPLTLLAHCSVMTGLDPPFHGVRDNGTATLPSSLPTLATVLSARGYATAAFVASRVLDRRFGLDRGFETYDDRMAAERQGEHGYPERSAEAVTSAAVAWLSRLRPGRPYSLWVHYYDPHSPYAPPGDWRGASVERRYAGEVASMGVVRLRARLGREQGVGHWKSPGGSLLPGLSAREPRPFAFAAVTLPVMETVRVEHWDSEDGPLTEKRLMTAMERDGYEVATFAYRAGTVFPEHEHGQDKCDGVLEGILRVMVQGAAYDLQAGDRIYLPAGTRHSAEVIGRKTVLSLDGTRW